MRLVNNFIVLLLIGAVSGCSAARCSAANIDISKNNKAETGSISYMPSELAAFFKKEIYQDRDDCENDEKALLINNEYYEIFDNSLLLFSGLPDYLCSSSRSFIPVCISKEGKWKWGKRIDGFPSVLFQDQEHTLWLITQSTVEASYPSLYTSKNGVNWTEIPLPENRNVDCCFEFVREICFQNNEIRVRFESYTDLKNNFELQENYLYILAEEKAIPENIIAKLKKLETAKYSNITDKHLFLNSVKKILTADEFARHGQQIMWYANKIEYWSASLESITKQPQWKKVYDKDIGQKPCSFKHTDKGGWFRQENESEIYFLYTPDHMTAAFPKSM
ncbi:hypothetical protein QUF76_05730 [Desulfobacterales bacterium HSG16]|nr:hypothetical protein [Desulfobacterales bacterium HSG16]